jgi:hypothetical protein
MNTLRLCGPGAAIVDADTVRNNGVHQGLPNADGARFEWRIRRFKSERGENCRLLIVDFRNSHEATC